MASTTTQDRKLTTIRSDLSVDERKEYIRAVLCLQSKPPKAPKDKVPGSLSRFDDFVATHMTMAPALHSSTNLFAAHRYFIYTYEKALREECGYQGYQPVRLLALVLLLYLSDPFQYMNYDRYANDPINSPMFDGSDSSMGGNGAKSTYSGIPQPFPRPYDMIPSAGGGGCVTTGPFKKLVSLSLSLSLSLSISPTIHTDVRTSMVVSLGPKSTIVRGIPNNPRADGLGSNPRCLRRDVNKFSAAGARANYTYSAIMDNKEIDAFYNRYLGMPQLKGDTHPWGVRNALFSGLFPCIPRC